MKNKILANPTNSLTSPQSPHFPLHLSLSLSISPLSPPLAGTRTQSCGWWWLV